jgi:hypothetical protein
MLNSSHQNTDTQQQLTAQLQWLEAALSALHSPTHDTQQRKAAEAALVAWQRTDPAWILCLHLFQHPYHPNSVNLLLFAAQTLRTKINDQGARLSAEHLTQLKSSLLQKLLDPVLPTAFLRQLCLAVASCVALLPSCSKDWLQAAGASLPMRNAVQLLHDVAEEGSSDWRHVIVPGKRLAGQAGSIGFGSCGLSVGGALSPRPDVIFHSWGWLAAIAVLLSCSCLACAAQAGYNLLPALTAIRLNRLVQAWQQHTGCSPL